MDAVELQGLGRRFGRRWALRGVNLAVEEGEMVAVWGESGAGKTVLLYLLSTLLRPSEGRAFVGGQDLRIHPSRVRSVVSIGFQSPSFDPQTTPLDGLELRAAMYGVSHAHRTQRIVQLLHLLGLEDCYESPTGTLSASQRRRLEVAAALLPSPRILLLDEPFADLEEEVANRIWEHLLDLRRRERMTLLLATAHASFAERCQRIAVLSAGRVVACNTADLIRSAAGKDVVTVQPLDERLTARRIQERLHVTVTEEEDGFKIEAQRGDTIAADILGSFGGQTAAIYVRRPSLEAGLRRIAEGHAPEDLYKSIPLATPTMSDS
jgi:ABC-2 type transport system ATP-binding protein